MRHTVISNCLPLAFSTMSGSVESLITAAPTTSSPLASLMSLTPLPGPLSTGTSSSVVSSAWPFLVAHATFIVSSDRSTITISSPLLRRMYFRPLRVLGSRCARSEKRDVIPPRVTAMA